MHSLEALYRAHANFVWRVVQRFGVPEEAAEDAVQEVFVVVRRRLPEYEGRGAPTTWLYAIARGVASNFRRRRARAERKLRVVPTPAPARTPEEEVAKARAVEMVTSFLAELDSRQRAVFELSDIEGLRGPEIAQALGLELNLVYSRLRLARRRFERYLSAHHDRQEAT